MGQSEIATDGVAASEIQDNSIDQGEIVDNTIDASELGTITRRSANVVVAAGVVGSVIANCLAGEQVMGGGNDADFDIRIVASRDNGNGWAVFGFNSSGANASLTAHAYCLAA